jgi:outer membrane immunogenic protein
MKRFLLASSFALAVASGSAFAADMSPPPPMYKAPLPPAPTWTGCYIDGGVGYGMWKQDHYTEGFPPLTALTPTVSTGGEGWLGRLGAGCDYQFSAFNSNFVIGVFGDYDFTGLSGSFQEPFEGFIGNENESGAWAVGARLGYLVTPTLLAFFDGGFTQARFDQINLGTDTVPSVSAGAYIPAHTYNGWFLGGGTEYALTWLPIRGLFWRSEYRYAGYESANLPMLTSAGAPFVDTGLCDIRGLCSGLENHMLKDVQTITTSLVWRFNY